MLRSFVLLMGCSLFVCFGCASRPASRPLVPPDEPAAACAARLDEFRAFVTALPRIPLQLPVEIPLPVTTVGDAAGPGPILEVSETGARIEGVPLAGKDTEERAAALGRWIAEHGVAAGEGRRSSLYVAAAPAVDVRTVRAYLAALPEDVGVRLLVRLQPPPPAGAGEEDAASSLAARMMTEPDPASRRELAAAGYERYSACSAFDEAVAAVGVEDRWPQLQQAVAQALGRCRCDELDTRSLELVLLAEQRASAGSLAALPLAFVRDERCGATMPLRAIQKLVGQMEAFDAEFGSQWREDALTFDRVLTNERLLVQFCDALPGETLAALQRARATLYWKRPDDSACTSWRFEPLEPGSPFGTWRRGEEDAPPLALHYRQAAETIRLFGPATDDPPSRPTDAESWACEETFSLQGIDERSIHLEQGRWFYSRETCDAAGAESAVPSRCAGAGEVEAAGNDESAEEAVEE